MEEKNLTTIVTDHEEAEEHAEPEGWSSEELRRRNGFSVSSQNGEPPLRRFGISSGAPHPTGNR